tara:strand:+ start:23 stop:1288 length:1266 start_codon:yes stop_codon:yes gene_type:complete
MSAGARMRLRDPENVIYEEVGKSIEASIILAWSTFNIPDPIYELPEFPAIRPNGPLALTQQALGLHSADKTGFRLRLEESVRNHYRPVPGYFDEEERRTNWMANNVGLLTDDVCTKTACVWLEQALDEEHPDTDRWYLGYSLLAGRVLSGSESASLSQSIPIMLVFGGLDRDYSSDAPHPSGVNALNCLLDASEQFSDSPSLGSWISILSMHRSTSRMLSISDRAASRIIREQKRIPSGCMEALINLISHDLESAENGLNRVVLEGSGSARMILAGNLDSIAGRDRKLALDLYDELSQNSDTGVLLVLSSSLYSLCYDDPVAFRVRAMRLIETEDDKVIRRLIESGFRGYLDRDPQDKSSLLVMAWKYGGSLSKSRLKGLIFQQKQSSEQSFLKTLSGIQKFSETEALGLLEYIEGREAPR